MSTKMWYALHVRSRHEFKVRDRLLKNGFEAFLPVVERLSKWKDRKKLVAFPLFPGYLFVNLNRDTQSLLAVLKNPGIVRFVGGIPGDPEQVPEEQVASLKRLVESRVELDPYPYLKEGQETRIKRGPLAGVVGILLKKEEQHLLVLSVDILRQGVSIKIDASDVEPI